MERGSFVCGYKCLSELDLFLKLLLLDSNEHIVSVHGKRAYSALFSFQRRLVLPRNLCTVPRVVCACVYTPHNLCVSAFFL